MKKHETFFVSASIFLLPSTKKNPSKDAVNLEEVSHSMGWTWANRSQRPKPTSSAKGLYIWGCVVWRYLFSQEQIEGLEGVKAITRKWGSAIESIESKTGTKIEPSGEAGRVTITGPLEAQVSRAVTQYRVTLSQLRSREKWWRLRYSHKTGVTICYIMIDTRPKPSKLYLAYYLMSPQIFFGIRKGSFVRAVNIHKIAQPQTRPQNVYKLMGIYFMVHAGVRRWQF